MKRNEKIYLKYLGGGWLPDVPAKDLTKEQADKAPYTEEELLNCGLWEKVEENKSAKKTEKTEESADEDN